MRHTGKIKALKIHKVRLFAISRVNLLNKLAVNNICGYKRDLKCWSLCPECLAVSTFVPIFRAELPFVLSPRDLMDPKE